MHLKTLTLRGFKSFASATTLHLEPGITAVVGPNGSGKSNVVDALAWVMGEQGAKTLRGGAMADVIFAGTTSRPPLGRAEVSLTIDNADGALPIAFSEVTISRTLFRNGGSEYAINGTPCRLLDIQELLSDTGMGREMHVVVGQGRLDSVLSATPEDRRGFIEEAAGVLKHRRRKERALRKLESMQAGLQRVTDLAAEIRRQLGPLARQADVARRAAVIQSDVRDSRARLLADDLVQAQAKLAAGSADEDALLTRKAEVEEELDAQRRTLAAVESAAAELSPRVREATDAYYELTSLKERFTSLELLATERVRHLGSPRAPRRGEDPDELDLRAEAAAEEEAGLRAEAGSAAAGLAAVESERKAAEDAERAAERALAAVHRGVADRREGLARLTGQVSTRRGRLESTQAELGRARGALEAARTRAESGELDFARLEQEVAGAETGEASLDAAHDEAQAELAGAQDAIAALDEREREAASLLANARTRAETLGLSLRREDATAALVSGGAAGITGTLPERVHVSGGWDDAVAAALGSWADAAVAETLGDAVDALRTARADETGEVRLVVASGDRPIAVDGVPDGLLPAVSAVSTADDATLAAVRVLLAGTVLTEDLTEARAVVAEHPHVVAVTRLGDVLGATHARGGAGESGSSVFALQSAAEEAAGDAERAQLELDAIRFEIGPARERVAAAESRANETLSDLHASDAALAATAEQLGQLGSTIRGAHAEIERTIPAIERLEKERTEHERELGVLAERLVIASREPDEAEADLAEATKRRDSASLLAREARRTETDARLRLRTVEERVKAIAGRAASLRAAAEDERTAVRRAEELERRRSRRAAVAMQIQDRAAKALRAVTLSLAQAADARAATEHERETHGAEITRTRARLDQLSAERSRLTDAAHRDEIVRAEQRLRIDQLGEKSIAELGLDPEILVNEFGPHNLVPVFVPGDDEPPPPRPYVREEQEARLAKASRDLQRLGKVNPLALEEHAALAERHQFLTDQVADLKKSRADLMEIVREIDERVEQVFGEAFRDTADQFEQVFARLFPGGEGRLLLTEPDDMLTTGIEIEARPAGKKVKRLSLLSGGERSLTAVALLIAIFKARPSPFYVMDEVEAALDDTNLGRLLEIYRELREDSQLIVVTHQKRTMEIADALYGVTMRDGVTTVVSQRLGRE
ncbi:MAG TPA: chromosome segregation protein SMC [Actinomycetaceae bacterium]|nr:chromosome segregation protein SMC [Actinomycetaceae bacterium]